MITSKRVINFVIYTIFFKVLFNKDNVNCFIRLDKLLTRTALNYPLKMRSYSIDIFYSQGHHLVSTISAYMI